MVGGSHTIIMRAEIYVDALGRIERWAGKLSLRRISLRFDLRSSWASEEAEMVIFYRERVACAKAQGSSVYSFTYYICSFYRYVLSASPVSVLCIEVTK